MYHIFCIDNWDIYAYSDDILADTHPAGKGGLNMAAQSDNSFPNLRFKEGVPLVMMLASLSQVGYLVPFTTEEGAVVNVQVRHMVQFCSVDFKDGKKILTLSHFSIEVRIPHPENTNLDATPYHGSYFPKRMRLLLQPGLLVK